MDDTTLARLAHENMIDSWIAVGGQVPGAQVERAGGVAVICTGLPLHLFNQVLVADPMASDDALVAAVTAARQRTERFVVNLRVGTDDRFVPLMDWLGLEADHDELSTPGLVLHPLPATTAARTPRAVDLRRVTGKAGIHDHVMVAASSFGIPEEWFATLVTEGLLRQPEVTLLVGYRDDAPVTTGLGIRTGRSMGIYNIATLESDRGQGLGAATTMRLVIDGHENRCEVAVLQSSPLARPLYERLGFRHIVQYLGFVPSDRTASTQPDLG